MAEKYALISMPMQISSICGVVQAMFNSFMSTAEMRTNASIPIGFRYSGQPGGSSKGGVTPAYGRAETADFG